MNVSYFTCIWDLKPRRSEGGASLVENVLEVTMKK